MIAEEFARQLSEYLHVPIEPKDDESLMDTDARTGNALVDFVRDYDTSKIEIGAVTFPPMPVKTTRGWYVADDESDPIILDSTTGEVWLKESGVDHILCYCAKDSDRFMEALLASEWVVYEGRAKGVRREEFDRRGAAETCAAVAGGDRYLSFYLSLFGAE